MQRFLEWHQKLGRLGVRLLWLHLLWCWWTLRGGILLGVFPATAAMHGVLRDDERHHGAHPEDPLELRGVRARFRELWHQEFGAANRLGGALAVIWAVLLADRQLVTQLDLGDLGPVLAGAHTVAALVLVLLTALVWPLQAQFNERAVGLLRRSLVLLAGRPATAALTAAALGLLLCAYYLAPGLVPVFGVSALAAAATACLWRTGVLVAPPRQARSPSAAILAGAPAAAAPATHARIRTVTRGDSR